MEPPRPAKISLLALYFRNWAANLVGQLIIALLNLWTPLKFITVWKKFLADGGWVLIPAFILSAAILATILQYLVQRPISDYLKFADDSEKDTPLEQKAKKRLLNLPILIGVINLAMWFGLDLIFTPLLHFLIDMTKTSLLYNFFRILMVGMIASFISFFLIDEYVREKLVPVFFPQGHLAAQPGAVKISILRRIRILFGAGTNAPMVLLVGTIGFAVWEVSSTDMPAGEFGLKILLFAIFLYIIFITVALLLNFLVGKSILRPIKDMMRVVGKVRDGDLHQKARVISSDELGVLGDGLNEMTDGLLERQRMQQDLKLAKEVQQALLPRDNPDVRGLDIAAQTVYCDETGGDCYDFIKSFESEGGKINVIVGDVSGHGLSAALLMATGRALLRQRTALPGSIGQIVTDVNRQLCKDFEEPGGFMTLFYLTIDQHNRNLRWVRAGHDPGIFYNPENGEFEELLGEGMALGVNDDHEYEEHTRDDLAAGQIIVLATDGIWEARNSESEMFGKEPIYRIIHQYADEDAKGILTACLYSLEKFQDGVAPEDDVTLIVIKIIDRKQNEKLG
jgi:sigma-B regulation protein RsbU (phosphoserine phosphatase)